MANTNEEHFKEIHLSCQCTNLGHMTVVALYEDLSVDEMSPPYSELHIHSQLSVYMPWWKRVWLAFKYVFGLSSRQAHWDTCMVRDEDLDAIIELVNRHKDNLRKCKDNTL